MSGPSRIQNACDQRIRETRGHKRVVQIAHAEVIVNCSRMVMAILQNPMAQACPRGTVKSGRTEVTVETQAAQHVADVRHGLVLGELAHSVENFRDLTGD